MSEKLETNGKAGDEEFLRHLPVTNEDSAFRADQLVTCLNCKRDNPPTRLKCLYCGTSLPLNPAQSATVVPTLRSLEAWEKGFNLIYLPAEYDLDESVHNEAAKILRRETDFVRRIVEAGLPLPLVRAESEIEAEIIKQRLIEVNVNTSIVSDAELAAEKPPQRLRGIEFFDEQIVLRLFNSDEIVAFNAEKVALAVMGATFQRRTESMEKRKKGERQILDATEVSSDELLLDIYTESDARGFRIAATGFDFSSLGDKNILAAENLRRLMKKLGDLAPDVKIDESYAKIRHLLGEVWEVEYRQDSQGLKRHSFGKFDFSRVESSSNLAQFTKYSRLQRHLL